MDFKDRLDARDLKQQRETQEKTQQQSKLMSALRAYLETLGPQVADACAKQGKDTIALGHWEQRLLRKPRFVEDERAYQFDDRIPFWLTQDGIWLSNIIAERYPPVKWEDHPAPPSASDKYLSPSDQYSSFPSDRDRVIKFIDRCIPWQVDGTWILQHYCSATDSSDSLNLSGLIIDCSFVGFSYPTTGNSLGRTRTE
jgi:hypothetical protein